MNSSCRSCCTRCATYGSSIFGKRPARAYHDKQWAAKMKSLGLMPSTTGMVGGKETGTSMQHYIIPDGLFVHTFTSLAATGWKLNLQSAVMAGGTKAPSSKVKFSCPQCVQNAWGKPDLAVTCTLCQLPMRGAFASTTRALLLYRTIE